MSDTETNLNDSTLTANTPLIPENNTFPHINSNGYVTIPMFKGDADGDYTQRQNGKQKLKDTIPYADNIGAIAFVWYDGGLGMRLQTDGLGMNIP